MPKVIVELRLSLHELLKSLKIVVSAKKVAVINPREPNIKLILVIERVFDVPYRIARELKLLNWARFDRALIPHL
jgi:hypothetical protein